MSGTGTRLHSDTHMSVPSSTAAAAAHDTMALVDGDSMPQESGMSFICRHWRQWHQLHSNISWTCLGRSQLAIVAMKFRLSRLFLRESLRPSLHFIKASACMQRVCLHAHTRLLLCRPSKARTTEHLILIPYRY